MSPTKRRLNYEYSMEAVASAKLSRICSFLVIVNKMGIFLSCCRDSSAETALITPDIETKRRQQAEAAERRLRELESRGIKDPQRLKEKTERLERLEKRHEEAAKLGADGNALRWTVD